jgi:hypothetical protein
MSLEIVHRQQEGIDVLSLTGYLTFGKEDLHFRKEMDANVRAGKIRVVLKLKELSAWEFGACEPTSSTSESSGASEVGSRFRNIRSRTDVINNFFADRHIRRYDLLDLSDRGKRKDIAPK